MNIQPLIEFLRGKKTYFAVAIGVLYIGGSYLGFWDCDPKVLAAVGLSSVAFLRAGVTKGPLLLFCFLLSAFCFSITGCQTALATKVGKDGTQDKIEVKSFLGKISNGSYSNGTGMTLSVETATPDQQSIAVLSGAVTDIAKLAILAARAPTNATPAATNSVTTNAPAQ